MATVLLAAAGAAVGGAVGGSVLGLSGVVIGRAIGATLGMAIDQRLMGGGSQVVETSSGQLERYRLTGASEGAHVDQVYGRFRVGGEVIWSTKFKEKRTTETTETETGGKGGGANTITTSATTFTYSISLAIALCEGKITDIGRIWADGNEIALSDLNIKVYKGSETQLPDPKMEAVLGAGNVPAYRGLAYVVIEDLQLGEFGNRVPQFSFEVMRAVDPAYVPDNAKSLSTIVKSVAMMPGTGEYALATTPVHFDDGLGTAVYANMNSPSGRSDFETSARQLRKELPKCESVSLIVSWFGDDLRCGSCDLKPKVEQKDLDTKVMPWSVNGVSRSAAARVPYEDDAAIYGGTPTDQSVVEAIVDLHDRNRDVMFYPFILMDQKEGNSLPDPWSGGTGQAHLPWRGRITTSLAPGLQWSPDGTAAAEAEVAQFFGTADVGDFTIGSNKVGYTGPSEWSYRRFILHYAHLCKLAGGVEAFCIGSEMRGLTQIRGANNTFPAVAQLRALAADVRQILGNGTKITYASDWSEYYGYHPQDGSGDVFFHLDPLWADSNIDFIGIDNYMPLSDWRDGEDHADISHGSIYNLDYLKSNIAGGEGFDWYYDSPEGRAFQIRRPIEDGAHGEDWVFRYKDIRGWWSNAHHNRIGGVRQASATGWVPESKPIWFTELGCAAIDKGTNQPNKFLDPKSSESKLPRYSNGRRDDLMQAQYLRAMRSFWSSEDNNPVSAVYGAPMVDNSRAHVWAWDARPYPQFPSLKRIWSDGGNYQKGHWLNGRVTSESLAAVVAEICGRSGITDIDVDGLYGLVHGYGIHRLDSARAVLQPLMLAYGFEAIERDGTLRFQTRNGRADFTLDAETLAEHREVEGRFQTSRAPEAETAGRVRLTYVSKGGDFEARTTEAIFPDDEDQVSTQSELPLVLSGSESRQITERWLAEARVARDSARFALPPSMLHVGAGDVVAIAEENGTAHYRVDHVDRSGAQLLEAVRVETQNYSPSDAVEETVELKPFKAPVPVKPMFLDLPLLTGDEVPYRPHLAVSAYPWPGSVAVYSSASDNGYKQNILVNGPAMIGVTETSLFRAEPGVWDRGPALRVRMSRGALSSVSSAAILNGANAMAIGDGSAANWEVFQFADVLMVSENIFELSLRLRGQQGTDALMPDEWQVGSTVVLLNSALKQINMASSVRGVARNYRIGPSQKSYDDPSYTHLVEAFDGVGLRPYAPVHLRARRDLNGDVVHNWIRRTRIDGDNWQPFEVPLGEDNEQYLVQVLQNGAILRETITTTPNWTYAQWQQIADGLAGPFSTQVAQISARFGAGPFRRIDINE